MPDPLVTVILTVFKRTEYLEAAVLSVLRQTFSSFEVLVTDDANQAQTRAICDQFGSDGRVRYRANPSTLGTPLNIAAALREARGQYIAILNDDDLLEPQMLERLVPPLEQFPRVVLAFGNYRIMDRAGWELPAQTAQDMRLRGHLELTPGELAESFGFALRRGVMVAFGCVFRRVACDPGWLVPEVGGAYDYWLAVKIASQGGLYFVPETLMSWRQHPDSVSAQVSTDNFVDNIFICRQLAGDSSLDAASREYARSQLACLHYLRGRNFLLQGWNIIEARNCFSRSYKTRWSAGAFSSWLLTYLPAWARRIGLLFWDRTRALRSRFTSQRRMQWG